MSKMKKNYHYLATFLVIVAEYRYVLLSLGMTFKILSICKIYNENGYFSCKVTADLCKIIIVFFIIMTP